jgi:hypothetical protein
LNKVEMLPWDVWGAGTEPGGEPTPEHLELFDSVAALTVDPDVPFDELRTRYETTSALEGQPSGRTGARGRKRAGHRGRRCSREPLITTLTRLFDR